MKKLTEKDKLELIAIIILAVVFTLFSISLLRKIKIRQPVSKGAGERLVFTASDFQYDSGRNKGITFLWEKIGGEITQGKRNPFASGSEGSGELIDLSLKGIIWNSGKPSAVINGYVLNIGDGINEFKVIQILKDKVILENEKSKLELKLNH